MKKFKKLVASLLAVLMLLGVAPVTALAGEIELHRINTTQQPAEEPAQEPVLGSEDVLPEEDVAEAAEPAAVSSSGFYRIVHLDCGRKYFSKDWIVALMYEAKAAGYNQVQLAFGNKGLRFLLDDMSVTVDDKTYGGTEVAQAIQVGNKAYYDAGERNELTQSEMDDIFRVANEIGIEIVPLFNTPFHMEAVITAMGKLGISNVSYSNKAACLNLSNTTATAFVKALMQKYVDYFSGKGCKYFNFGADEYEGGWNSTFYNYANGIVDMISGAGMTARIFNDSFRSEGITNYVENAQVCYWSSNAGYASTSVVNKYAKEIINTNQDFYYVVNRDTQQSTWSPNSYYAFSGSYDETKWVDYAKGFSNTKYKNFAGYNNGAESVTPVGSMFCIWCDNPSHKDETQIAKETRMIMRVIGARMKDSNDYSGTDFIVEGGFNKDGTINASAPITPTTPTIKDEHGCEGKIEVAVGKSTKISLPEGVVATWTVTEGTDVVELVADGAAAAQTRSAEPAAAAETAAITGNAVQVRALKAGTATITATLDDGTAVNATVTVKDNTKKPITVTVGGTEEVTIEGNHAGTYTTANPEIATVTAVHTKVDGETTRVLGDKVSLYNENSGTYTGVLKTENGNNFIKIDENDNISNVTDVNEATVFEVTKSSDYNATYTIKVKDKNLYLGISNNNSLTMSSSSTSWSVGTGHDFYSGSSSYIYIYYNNGWKYQSVTDNWGNCAKLFTVTEETTQAKDQTKLTFTGHKVGTTTATIAGVEYTINVVPAELGNAEKLYIDFWVTNHRIYPTNLNVVTTKSNAKNNARTYYEFSAADFYGIDGKALAEVIPGTGNYESITGTEALYWKTRYLPVAYRQTEAGWTNKSGYGTDTVTGNNGGVDIERIRYYGNKWEYKAVGVDGWTEFNGTTADETGNQIVAYYMLKTTVTKEVTTYITDWPDNQTDEFYGVAVDYCVKYESGGERNPNTFGSGKNQNTQWFNCDGTKNSAAHNNGYSVLAADVADDWKGLRTTTSTDWYRVINNIRAVETDNYDIYMVTVTPSASFNLNAQQCPTSITYNAKNEKVIWAESEDTITTAGLTRHSEAKIGGAPNIDKLVIQQCSGMLVTYYVRAKETPDALKVHYVNQKNNEEFYSYNIIAAQGTVFPENPNFSNNTLHNYSVQNIEGKTETVLSDLKLIPKIAAQYRYSKFTCVEVKRIEGGKDFYLYYTFDYEVNFVVDFGLPITITPEKINPDMVGKAVKVDIQQKNVDYGTITIAENNLDFTYTLKKMIDGYDTIVATYSGSQGNSAAFNINIIPATTVYYEDSFVDFYDAGSSAKKTAFTQTTESDAMGEWYVEGNANTTAEQALSKLGDKAIYGYDPAYNNSTTFSMGSAKKVTVNDASGYAQAKFTFKGTGFDVISLTNSDSGAITVEVLKDGTTAKTKDGKNAFYLVNNYYGYKQEGGQWVVDPTATNTLYQIPVMKVSGLDYGTYTAVITVDYAKFFDKTNDNKYSFWLDAIRIYDPMGVDNATYTKDNEGFPQYIKLRDEIKNSTATVKTTLFIDGAADATISEYNNYGPNNEVYLANGQAISFKIPENANIKSVQIGAKAPKGTATMTVNNDEGKVIETATEMYYEISKIGGSFTITNTGAEILSLTNLKVTYSTEGSVSLAPMNAEEQTSAVMMVRAMFAPPVPTVFEPETFTVSLKNYKDVYVREYIKVTVTTSDDVKYITVGDKRISRYDDERVWGGFRKGFVKTGKRVWSYYVSFDTAGQQVISVVAYDADGLASEAVENTVNIKPRSAWRGKKSEWHI